MYSRAGFPFGRCRLSYNDRIQPSGSSHPVFSNSCKAATAASGESYQYAAGRSLLAIRALPKVRSIRCHCSFSQRTPPPFGSLKRHYVNLPHRHPSRWRGSRPASNCAIHRRLLHSRLLSVGKCPGKTLSFGKHRFPQPRCRGCLLGAGLSSERRCTLPARPPI